MLKRNEVVIGNGNLQETDNVISYEQEVCIMSIVNSMAMFENTNSDYSNYYVAKNRVERILEDEYGMKVKITISCIHDSISINIEGK